MFAIAFERQNTKSSGKINKTSDSGIHKITIIKNGIEHRCSQHKLFLTE